MKISYVMNVLNGEPFIKHQLDSIYNHAHEIIIIEGAYKKFSHACSSEGRSIDSTIKVIENYPDQDNKIKLVQKPGFYSSRLSMCNEFFEHVTGEVIWQVDVDEFYLDSTHLFVANLFKSDLELDRICFNFYDFFGSLDYFIKGYEHIGLDNIRRVHRYNKGEKWSNQRPPTLSSNNKEKIVRKELTGNQMQIKGHKMFHPTLLFDKQIKDKYQYYSSISSSVNNPDRWVNSVWHRYQNKFNISGIKNYITYLEKFESRACPPSLVKMYTNVKSGKHKGFDVRNMDDVDRFMSSSLSKDYREIAQSLFQYLYVDRSNFKYINIFKIVFVGIQKLDRHTLAHFLRVLLLQIVRRALKGLKLLVKNQKTKKTPKRLSV